MVVWYIFSVISIVIGTVALIRGAYLLYDGIRYSVADEILWGASRVALAVFIALLLWAVGFPWGGEWFELFVAEYAVPLRIIAVVLFLTIGIPLIGICLALIKWFLIDPRKKTRNNNLSSNDDKECEH